MIGSTEMNRPVVGSYSRAPRWVRPVGVVGAADEALRLPGQVPAAVPRGSPNGVVRRRVTVPVVGVDGELAGAVVVGGEPGARRRWCGRRWCRRRGVVAGAGGRRWCRCSVSLHAAEVEGGGGPGRGGAAGRRRRRRGSWWSSAVASVTVARWPSASQVRVWLSPAMVCGWWCCRRRRSRRLSVPVPAGPVLVDLAAGCAAAAGAGGGVGVGAWWCSPPAGVAVSVVRLPIGVVGVGLASTGPGRPRPAADGAAGAGRWRSVVQASVSRRRWS